MGKKWILVTIVCFIVYAIVITGIMNFLRNSGETIGRDYYSVSRINSPWSFSQYTAYYSKEHKLESAWRGSSLSLFEYYELFNDVNGDGEVDIIITHRIFGQSLSLIRDFDEEFFAAEFQKADRIFKETKTMFADKIKNRIELYEK